jgi:hypothetical protein
MNSMGDFGFAHPAINMSGAELSALAEEISRVYNHKDAALS